MLPITITAGYFRISLLTKLNIELRRAYYTSSSMVCEQIAAIRTVASLNRELALHNQYMNSLAGPLRKFIYSTLKSAAVPSFYQMSDIALRFGSKSRVFFQCNRFLVWEHPLAERGMYLSSVLCVVHTLKL